MIIFQYCQLYNIYFKTLIVGNTELKFKYKKKYGTILRFFLKLHLELIKETQNSSDSMEFEIHKKMLMN